MVWYDIFCMITLSTKHRDTKTESSISSVAPELLLSKFSFSFSLKKAHQQFSNNSVFYLAWVSFSVIYYVLVAYFPLLSFRQLK